ncbi:MULTISPECIES: AraC family transcriptional regulator [unclassified Spirosoma]|uniref:AraC family transcriptional regulator n=1 Tax=unclassified Spirosoma TaxID=2621999 RepID=UPI0025FA27D5|nr:MULTISPECIES: helix-turn-helix transcriptional regulator [unclassified Spirosoma]
MPEPEHPLVSVNGLITGSSFQELNAKPVVYNFYSICIKKNFTGKVRYGQTNYDHDAGMLSFYAPGQVTSTEISDDGDATGHWLIFHPDLVRNYPLASKLNEYGFFAYATHEALHLSAKEEQQIEKIWDDIRREYQSNIDSFSQDVIVSHIDLLLTYCNRFYNRQFITRKKVNHDILIKFEAYLNDYFAGDAHLQQGLPDVHYFAGKLFISAQYLSDLLRNLTGLTTQQHIHNHIIEVAKNKLIQTNLSVGEIAYSLGFDYSQSFNKLFKNKTGMSPGEFRNLN